MSLADLFGPLDELLRRSGVRYAVIGAYAVAAWGTIRATRDLDLLIETKDIDLLRAALSQAGFDFEYRPGDPDDPIQCVLRLISEGGPQEIDVLAGIKGSPPGITDRVAVVELSRLKLRVAAPEDVIVLKLLAGSLQDIEDARAILRTQGTLISRHLLLQLCPAHLQGTLQSLLQEFL
jgi:predicted nucleotidyltransferase